MVAVASEARGPASRRRVAPFGPDDCLLGAINDVSAGNSKTGAILWGLGVAEVKTARRLAKNGIASLQVRINGVEFSDVERRNTVYSDRGVEYCRLAMDELSRERDLREFILMGNCACASFCLNAALADPRVVGLILTNPHITKRQLLRVSLWHKLLKFSTWKRLFRGGVNLRSNIDALGELASRKLRRRRLDAVESSFAARNAPSDLELPEDLDVQLGKLAERGVETLIACASEDDSLHYLRARYGRALDALEATGKVSFERVETGTHVFSTDDGAAALLNDAISRWIGLAAFVRT